VTQTSNLFALLAAGARLAVGRPMTPRLLLLCVLLTACGSQLDITEDDETYALLPDDEVSSGEQHLAVNAPLKQRAGAWWGDTKTPLNNQVWGEVLNAIPGKNITAPYTFQWTCNVPTLAGGTQTLKLTTGSFSVNSDIKKAVSNPLPGQVLSYTLDPASLPAGWIEVRIRCKGTETTGTEKGQVTAITAGFPLQIKGGTAMGQNHSNTDYVDTHGWYSRGVDYVYATVLNVSSLVNAPQKGVMTLKLRARTSGDTTLDHFMIKVDGQIAKSPDLQPLEFFGTTGDRTVYIDTKTLANGPHVLAMHSHGLEKSGSEQPGKQLAAQSEVTFTVQN
jgi:hypothetical protein